MLGCGLSKARHFRVGIWLCLDSLTVSFCGKWVVYGGIVEDGLVMGLSLSPEGPEMRGSCCSDGHGMGLP